MDSETKDTFAVYILLDQSISKISEKIRMTVKIDGTQKRVYPILRGFDDFAIELDNYWVQLSSDGAGGQSYIFYLHPRNTGLFTIGPVEAYMEGNTYVSAQAIVKVVGQEELHEPQVAAALRSQSMYPIKILFLAANPLDTSPLRLGEEVRTIDERLRAAQFREKFEVIQHHAVRITDLSEVLLRHQPHIVHFSGHGSPSGQLVLEDVVGSAEYVASEAIARLFRILKDNVRCVILNACFTVNQAQEIAKHIECVVGTSRAIGDETAIRFAGGFYRAIGYGRNVKTAFDLGCNEIGLASIDGQEDTPQLLSRADANPETIYLAGSAA